MAVIIKSEQDDGSWVSGPELADRVLEVAPEATVRMVKGSVSGVEVEDRVAVLYLMTLYTAKGNPRKGGNDG